MFHLTAGRLGTCISVDSLIEFCVSGHLAFACGQSKTGKLFSRKAGTCIYVDYLAFQVQFVWALGFIRRWWQELDWRTHYFHLRTDAIIFMRIARVQLVGLTIFLECS